MNAGKLAKKLNERIVPWRCGDWETCIEFVIGSHAPALIAVRNGCVRLVPAGEIGPIARIAASDSFFRDFLVDFLPLEYAALYHDIALDNYFEIIKLQYTMSKPFLRADEPPAAPVDTAADTDIPGLGIERLPIGLRQMSERIRAVLRITGGCNQNCTFCVGSFLAKEPVPVDIDAALRHIAAARIPSLFLTGGEPTIHPGLADIVRRFRENGGWRASMQTNGVRLADKSYTASLKKAGVELLMISLNGAEAKTHDSITRVNGSFSKTLAGIRNAVEAGIATIASFVICTANYRELPTLAELVCDISPDVPLALNYMTSFMRSDLATRELIPSFTDVAPYINAAYEAARERGQGIGIYDCFMGAPPCAFPSVKKIAFCPNTNVEGFSKLAFCKRCRFNSGCAGFHDGYLALYRDAFSLVPL